MRTKKILKKTLFTFLALTAMTSLPQVAFAEEENTFSSLEDEMEKVRRQIADMADSLPNKGIPEDVDPEFASILSDIQRNIQNSLYAGLRTSYSLKEAEKDEAFFGSLFTHAFQTTTLLSQFAKEPLFLTNKEEISFGFRPFLMETDQDVYESKKIGLIATLRQQTASSFKQAQLYAAFHSSLAKEPIHRKRILSNSYYIDGKELALALTGGFRKEKIGGALQLVLGGDFAYSKRYYLSGKQKVLFVGLSPILTVTPRPFPVDFFVGGDVVFAKRPLFEEDHKDFYENIYDKQKKILWRVKAGPSYTFQRETKRKWNIFVVK